MASFSSLKTGFTGIQNKINQGLYKKDSGLGGEFEKYEANGTDFAGKIVIAPQDARGIEGFVFDIGKAEELTFESVITEHVLEDKRVVASHKTNKPKVYKTGGFVGEIYVQTDVINNVINIVQDKLGILSQYKVPFTASANQKINNLKNAGNKNVNYVKDAYKNGKNLADIFNKKNASPNISRIEDASQFLNSLKDSNILCNISTKSYGYLSNMMVESLYIRRDYATNIAEFDITFKEIREVGTQFVGLSGEDIAKSEISRANASRIVKKGEEATKKKPVSTLKQLGSGALNFLSI